MMYITLGPRTGPRLGVSPDATSPDGREFDEARDGANQRARTTRSVHRTEKAGNTVMYSLILTETYFAAGSPCLSHSSWRIWGSSSS